MWKQSISSATDFATVNRKIVPPKFPKFDVDKRPGSQSVGSESAILGQLIHDKMPKYWQPVSNDQKLLQGGHIQAEMKFPVFSPSFPCVT